MTALPFASGSFEAVICLEGIAHIFLSEADAFLKEAARVLTPGGELLVTVPLLKEGRHSSDPLHLYEFAAEEIQALLERWFEPVESEIQEGGDNPDLWFVGRRRVAALELPPPRMSATPRIEAAARWLELTRIDGGFAYAVGGRKTLVSTCISILLLEGAGALETISEPDRSRWIGEIRSCQDSDTGLFADPLLASSDVPSRTHDREYLIWQTTYYALQALDALGATASAPLTFVERFLDPKAVESWLDELNWSNAWLESNRIMFLLAAVIYRVEREHKTGDAALLHRVFDWLDREQDPRTGVWGTTKGSGLLNALAGAYHFVPFYEYVRRPVPAATRMIDAALSLQKADGLFAAQAGGGACEDLDAIDVLTVLGRHTTHRAGEIRRAAIRAYWAVWNLQKADGSFPYSGRPGNETYSYSGWEPATAGQNDGDVWSTWFRAVLLATVSAAYPQDTPSCRWRFRRWPALGYHRQDETITPDEGATLPLWLRTVPQKASDGARVTVVITCYNLGRYLHEAIASAAQQTLPAIRIVVVDDGSSDEFTRFLFDAFPYPGVALVRQPNGGVAAARNAAIAQASTEYICCLDADDRLRPEYLFKAVGLLDSNREIGFVSCFYALFDCGQGAYRYTDCRLPEMLARNEAVVSSVFRKEAWAAAGGYSLQLTGMQDWDLWIGMLGRGFRGEVLREILFDYRIRPGSMYSVTSRPENYERLCRQIVSRHLALYSRHAADVIAIKSRHFMELVRLGAQQEKYQAGREDAVREQQNYVAALEEAKQWLATQAERWQAVAAERQQAAAELQDRIAALEEAKHYLQTQAGLWRRTAESRDDIVAPLQQYADDLERQVAKWQLAHDRLSEELATRPGVAPLRAVVPPRRANWLSGLLRTAAMVLSLRPSSKWTNLGLWTKTMLNPPRRRLWMQVFDRDWYRTSNRDVAISGVNSALHYVLCGHLENRAASPVFDAPGYLRLHKDVKAHRINPLLHYVLYGVEERRLAPASAAAGLIAPGLPAAIAKPAPVLRRFTARQQGAGPLVSVVIPCFNYGLYVAEAIASVAAQTFTNWEVVVVEGGSSDPDTVQTVRNLEAKGLPRTTFLYREGRHLVGDNRNAGIRQSRGEYICCLDADDLLKPTYLEVALFVAETYGYDLVYPSVQCFGESTERWLVVDTTVEQLLDHNQVSTVALFRRSAWDSIGGYRDWGLREEYVPEDWHFWTRMVGEGYRPKAITEALMLYRVKQDSLWHSTQARTDVHRAKIGAACQDLARGRPKVVANTTPGNWERLLPADGDSAVLLALPFLTIGGAEQIFESLTCALIARGRRVVIVTSLVLPETVRDNRAHFEKITPHVYSLPHLFEGRNDYWPDFLSYLLSRYRVDTIFAAGSSFLYGLLPAIRRTFPEIAVVDQLFNDQVHLPSNRAYAEYIDMTVVPSAAFANRLLGEYGEQPQRVAVIPHGVPVLATSSTAGMCEARERAGLPAELRNCLLVGFFGRMSAEKGPLDFVEMARALSSDPQVAFVMTGEGTERAAVLDRIAEYGLQTRVHAPGFVENVADLMRAVDVVAVPSRLDGMPLVVLEALGAEKAVVASRVGSIPEMVRHRETGLLCAPGGVAEFVSAVREFQRSPQLRQRLGAAGREWVLRNYSAETMVSRYLAAFAAARDTRGPKTA